MILDNENQFSRAQAVTGAATTASTDLIDLSVLRPNLGSGKDLYVVVNIDVAAGGTTPTMAVLIQTDDNVGFASPATLFTGPTLAAAALVTSTQLVYAVPATGMERYLRLAYTLGGTSPTITVTASIVENYTLNPAYASGFTVQ